MPTDQQLQSAFILTALNEYGRRVSIDMRRAMVKLKAIDTDALNRSVAYITQAGNESHQGKLQLIFKEYGRMVDMGVGRGYKNDREGRRDKLTNRRQAKKIYSPVAYGNLNYLINELQYGYTEAVRNNLKQTLENPLT